MLYKVIYYSSTTIKEDSNVKVRNENGEKNYKDFIECFI